MKLKLIAGLIRVWTLPMTASLILLGAAYAFYLGLRVSFLTLLLALSGSLLLHAGANVLNDVNDTYKGVDKPESPTALYRPHPLLKGEISMRSALILALSLIASGVGVGLIVSLLTAPSVLLLTLAGTTSLFSYNGPLLNLKARGAGEFLVSAVWGPMFVLGGFAASSMGTLSLKAFLVSIPAGMIMFSVIYSNNYRDIPTDVVSGVKSFAYRTAKYGAIIYSVFIFGAYFLQLVYEALGILDLLALINFLTLPYAFYLVKLFKRKPPDIDARTGVLFTAFNVLLALGLLIKFVIKA